jgi:S1-C subfamily serine protease
MKNAVGTTSVVTAAINGNEEVFGATLQPLGRDEMRSFNVDYGVKIGVLNDGKFKDLGMKRGYIILNVNGKKIKSPSDVKQFTNNQNTLKSIGGIQSDGTLFSYTFGN